MDEGSSRPPLKPIRETYTDLVETATDIIYVTDLNGNFTLVNPQGIRITGYSKEEIIGKNYIALVRQDFRKEVARFYESQFAQRIAHTYNEFPIVTKNGATVWLGQNVHLVMDSGKVSGFQSICRDITETKKAEDLLNASERRFRLLVDAAPFGLSIMHGDRTFEYFNPKFTEILGYTLDNLPNKDTWFRHAYPDAGYRNLVMNTWHEDTVDNVSPGEVSPRVFTVRCKDGSDKTIRFQAVVMEDGSQIMTYEDVTVKERNERAMREQEQMLNNILAASPVGICRVEDRKFSWVNDAMVKMFGYESQEEFMGKPTREVYASEEEYNRVGARLYDASEGGTESETYAKLARKNGSIFDGHVRISSPDASNRTKGTIAAFADISRIREAERALKKSERRYRALVEQVPDVIFSMDSEGRFTFVNAQAEKFLGYSSEEMLGEPLWQYCEPEFRNVAQSVLAVCVDGVWEQEVGMRDSSGERKWVRIRCGTETDDEGRAVGFEGVLVDTTERKKLEEELKASREELLAKIKIIDDLYAHMVQSGKSKAIADHTAEVAHELRQPLAIIGGFARRMSNQLESLDNPVPGINKEWFQIMIREVQRLESILRGLIDFTRRQELQLEKIDPNKVVAEVLGIHQERFREKELILETNFGSHVKEIWVDTSRFHQVIRNLVSNAIEASLPGGVVSITTDMFRPSDKEQQTGELRATQYFEMKISNGGPVIPPEELKRFFDPFYTTKEYGIGVGLTLVKRIVEDHKGSISVKSDQSGTVFTLWLPVSQSAWE